MENDNTSTLPVASQRTSTSNSSADPPDYFSDLTPTLSLPPYPNRERDPPPPEYYEIMRFNASSYAWTFPQHQLQSAMDAGDMSPLPTATIARNDMRRAEDQYTTSAMRPSEREGRLSPARQNPEEFNEEERARVDRALRRRMEEGDMGVRRHCRPVVYHTNSVGRLASTLQRWTELLEIGDEDGETGGIGSRKRSEVEVPGWIKARIEETKSHRSKRKMLNWFRKSRSYHV